MTCVMHNILKRKCQSLSRGIHKTMCEGLVDIMSNKSTIKSRLQVWNLYGVVMIGRVMWNKAFVVLAWAGFRKRLILTAYQLGLSYEVKESYSLYGHIYIFCVVVS